MSAFAFALGIDPGPTTGVALLRLGGPGPLAAGAEIFQCSYSAAPWLVSALLDRLAAAGSPCLGGIESFVRGAGAGARKRTGRATADQVAALREVFAARGVPLRERNAGTVKPWAERNDCKRLRASGLLDLVPGSAHAKSALGQALYTAVTDCDYPDPLSQRGVADASREKPG